MKKPILIIAAMLLVISVVVSPLIAVAPPTPVDCELEYGIVPGDPYNGSFVCGTAGQTTYTYYVRLDYIFRSLDEFGNEIVSLRQTGQIYAGGEGFPCGKTPYFDTDTYTAPFNRYKQLILKAGYFQTGNTKVETHSAQVKGCFDATPILIPLTNAAIQLTSPADGVQFNLCGCGTIQQTSWTRAGDQVAWLARDLNGDGLINNGKELFGDASEQGPPLYDDEPANGYRALRLLDNNSDGKITSADSEFAQLKLWVDLNHNGFSESSELLTPAQAGLTEISTDYKPVGKKDQHGNEFKFRSDVMVNGHKRVSYDVFLSVQ